LASSPFANEYVFYEVLIAVAYSTVGMAGLRILFGVVNILPFVLVVGIWLKYRRGFRFSYWFALAFAVGLLSVGLRQRKEVVCSALLVGLGLFLLLRSFPTRLSRFYYVIVAGILCVWANSQFPDLALPVTARVSTYVE
jgi:hypothetical protein